MVILQWITSAIIDQHTNGAEWRAQEKNSYMYRAVICVRDSIAAGGKEGTV